MASNRGQMYLDGMFSTTKDDTEDLTISGRTSEIASFYAGRKILLTGGSGFLGQLLVEKLLRSCPDIAVLYLFMRGKKGKSSLERYKEYFEDIIFHRLQKEQPNFKEKVVMIEADTSEIDLGLSPESRERLKDTEIIFHAAATVRFDEKLRIAVNINVRGTKQLILLGKEMPNLKCFVHISTAFSHCVRKFIDETLYEPPMKTDNAIKLVEILNDDELAVITPRIIGQWPNTYTYTKAIGEDTVQQYSNGIPICIVRPSIMIATMEEPIRGWINNLYGPTGTVLGVAYGILRTLHSKQELIADLIPADIVINNVIAAAWAIAQKRKDQPSVTDANENKCTTTEDIAIYNSVSSVQNNITWGKFMEATVKSGLEMPSSKAYWYYVFVFNRYKFMYNICVIFLHLLPAVVIDTIFFLMGKKPMMWKAYKKIHKFSKVISYFSTQQWKFKNDRVMSLWDKLSTADRQIFCFNIAECNWDVYMRYYVRGIRLYLANDPLDSIEEGRIKYKKLKIAHYTLVTLLCLLILWSFYSLFSFIYTQLFSS